MKKNNLKPWQPGMSGNPRGRPKGSRNVKKIIQDMLNDKNTYKKLAIVAPRGAETPLEAIVYTLMVKAMRADIRAADVLLKYSVERDTTIGDEGGFFSPGMNQLVIRIVDSKGNQIETGINDIPEDGQLPGFKDPIALSSSAQTPAPSEAPHP